MGRAARNYVELHANLLGMNLAKDSKAADEWETSNGGRYFCAGVTAGIAGHRFDIGFIDDPIGSEEEARSETQREKVWQWFWNDFMPRSKPNGSVIIMANRRHEDDLIGRLLATEPEKWRVIKLPFIIESEEQEINDPLGRKIGDVLWPEWFNEKTVSAARMSSGYSGLYQQDPVPPSGDLIKAENLLEYWSLDELPPDLVPYVGSDHALTEKEENDASCLIPIGVDPNGDIWVRPDVFWERVRSNALVSAMLDIAKRHRPAMWFAENEHIKKAIGPFLNERMRQDGIYFPIRDFTSIRDIVARSSSIRGMIEQQKVHFPAFTTWWPRAKAEMLSFPKAKHDDFVSALCQIGIGLDSLSRPAFPMPESPEFGLNKSFRPTISWIKSQHRLAEPVSRYDDR